VRRTSSTAWPYGRSSRLSSATVCAITKGGAIRWLCPRDAHCKIANSARHGIALCEGLGSTDQVITIKHVLPDAGSRGSSPVHSVQFDCFKLTAFEVIQAAVRGLFFLGIVFSSGAASSLLVRHPSSAAIYCGFALCYLARTRGQFIEFGLPLQVDFDLFLAIDPDLRGVLALLPPSRRCRTSWLTVATNPQLNPNAPKGFGGLHRLVTRFRFLTAFGPDRFIEAFHECSRACFARGSRTARPLEGDAIRRLRLISTNLGGRDLRARDLEVRAREPRSGFFVRVCFEAVVSFVMPIIRRRARLSTSRISKRSPSANQPVGAYDAHSRPRGEWRSLPTGKSGSSGRSRPLPASALQKTPKANRFLNVAFRGPRRRPVPRARSGGPRSS
jgi:hypothetical protein